MTVIGAVAFVTLVVGSVAFGLWLAGKLGIDTSHTRHPFRSHRVRRAQLRHELTIGERAVVRIYKLSLLLPPAGVALLVWGTHSIRGVGIGLLIAGLLVMAFPVSPFLHARIRRRAGRGG